MANKYNEQDYIYGSARISAVNARSVPPDRFQRAAEAVSSAEAMRIFEENGIPNINSGDTEKALSAMLDGTYDILKSCSPDPHVFDMMRYPYDCHNIKSAVKCSFKNINPGHLLYNVGTVPPQDIQRMARERDFSMLPHNMAIAAAEAFEVYSRTSDPQRIDIAIDRACYLDMERCAEEVNIPFLKKFVEYKADITNILTCIRLIKMNASQSAMYEHMIPCGILNISFFEQAFKHESIRERTAALIESAASTRYNLKISPACESMTEIERACDLKLPQFTREEARQKLYGAEILASYVTCRETEIKNIRIVLSGRAASLEAETIKSRLRI